MNEDIPYRSSDPEWERELKEHAKLFNKDSFYREIDKIPSINQLSEEMRLVLEFLLRFQWLEEEAKDLLWTLYGATSETRLNTYMTAKKREDIRGMYTKDIVRELGYFHIAEDGYRDELEEIASELRSLAEVRNRITHALYSKELPEKKALVSKLKDALKRLGILLKRVEKLSIVYMSIAAELEIQRKAKGI